MFTRQCLACNTMVGCVLSTVQQIILYTPYSTALKFNVLILRRKFEIFKEVFKLGYTTRVFEYAVSALDEMLGLNHIEETALVDMQK